MILYIPLTTEQRDYLNAQAAREALSYSDHDIMASITPGMAGLNAAETERMNWLIHLTKVLEADGWLPIENAKPKDGPILGWCVHGEDPYRDPDDPNRITIYAAHADAMGHAEDGPHVLEWGGAVDDSPDDGGAYIPDWWFVTGTEFEVVANPTHYKPIGPGPVS